jgi:DME family drug/metabolite transporter
MTSRPGLGVALALAAAMLWGTTGTAQHFAPSQLSPYWIGALRLVIAAAFFGLWVAATERASPRIASPRAALVRTLLAGVCLAFYNLAFFAGVKLAGVAVGTTIAIGSGPLFAGAMQAAFTRRVPAGLWWLGTALAIAGGALVALGEASALHIDGLGIALCLLAGLGYASYTLLAKSVARQASPARTNRLVFGAAAIVAVPLAWALSAGGAGALASSSASGWLVVAYLGVMATGVSYLLFASALRHISGATGVALAQAEPLTAFTLAVLVLGEPLHVGGVVGMAAMLAGLALVVAGERRAAAASTM